MSVTVDQTLMEAAQHIVPVIRAYTEEAARERHLSKPVLDALTQAGLLRMFIPRSLGGLEVIRMKLRRSPLEWPGKIEVSSRC